ncbi:MAG: hypothetical protein PHI49_11490 [Halothiobacillaceae bacterium]|nr:hypothetical protein [Halothiobacillaceae bacterium]
MDELQANPVGFGLWLLAVWLLVAVFYLRRRPRGYFAVAMFAFALPVIALLAALESEFRNAVLALSMVVTGVALAPWFTSEPAAPRARRESVLAGLMLINGLFGASAALLGLVALVEYPSEVPSRLDQSLATLAVFLGGWSFASGIAAHLRVTGRLPDVLPTLLQRVVKWLLLLLTLLVGWLVVTRPELGLWPLVVFLGLTLASGGATALSVSSGALPAVEARQVGMLGLSCVAVAVLQDLVLLLIVGGLAISAALSQWRLHYRRE